LVVGDSRAGLLVRHTSFLPGVFFRGYMKYLVCEKKLQRKDEFLRRIVDAAARILL
jgi:hypothetical protein